MNRLPTSPLITKGLEIAEKHLGLPELSRRLGVHETTVHAWRLGHATMPEHTFLRLVDILTELDPDWTAKAPKP
jgi:hypothetical protein